MYASLFVSMAPFDAAPSPPALVALVTDSHAMAWVNRDMPHAFSKHSKDQKVLEDLSKTLHNAALLALRAEPRREASILSLSKLWQEMIGDSGFEGPPEANVVRIALLTDDKDVNQQLVVKSTFLDLTDGLSSLEML